ncbi:MAG: hypothetical protein GF398_16165 [Chitinivibrionales bacterium]|nr:hypothetical protein [Chitinivibrionales bacterium]
MTNENVSSLGNAAQTSAVQRGFTAANGDETQSARRTDKQVPIQQVRRPDRDSVDIESVRNGTQIIRTESEEDRLRIQAPQSPNPSRGSINITV